MAVLSLLNPFGWFGSSAAKLSGGNQPSASGATSYSGKPVTPERALELAAYWACVKIIAQTIGTLSLRLYNQAADGSRTPAVDNPLYDLLLHQPNADHSAVEFWEGVGACLAIWGNAFVLKTVRSDGVIVALELLRPYWMQVTRDRYGAPVYTYNDPIVGTTDYGPLDLMVVRGFGLCDLTGLSPISYARQTIGSAIAADEAAGSLFRNGMRMSGWFKYKGGNGILTKAQQDDTKAALIAPYVGSENTGKVGLLPGDFDWLATAMSPVEADLLNNRRMGVEEICRFFGVPPILVGHTAQGQTMWGTGVDAVVLGFMTTGLRPYLKRIEAAGARDLIGRGARQSLVMAFDTTELLRGDNKGQAEIDRTLIAASVKTPNETRAERNLPPKPGGDKLMVQGAMLPLEDLGLVAKLPTDRPVAAGADVHADPSISGEDGAKLFRAFELGLKFNPHHGSGGRFASADGGAGASVAHEGGGSGELHGSDLAKHNLGLIAKGAALVAVGSLAVALGPEITAVSVASTAVIGIGETMFARAGASSARAILTDLGIDTTRIEKLVAKVTDTFKAAPSDADLLGILRSKLAGVADHTLAAAVAGIDDHYPASPNKAVVSSALTATCERFKAKLAAG